MRALKKAKVTNMGCNLVAAVSAITESIVHPVGGNSRSIRTNKGIATSLTKNKEC